MFGRSRAVRDDCLVFRKLVNVTKDFGRRYNNRALYVASLVHLLVTDIDYESLPFVHQAAKLRWRDAPRFLARRRRLRGGLRGGANRRTSIVRVTSGQARDNQEHDARRNDQSSHQHLLTSA